MIRTTCGADANLSARHLGAVFLDTDSAAPEGPDSLHPREWKNPVDGWRGERYCDSWMQAGMSLEMPVGDRVLEMEAVTRELGTRFTVE